MEIRLALAGQPIAVRLESGPNGYDASIDGEAHHVVLLGAPRRAGGAAEELPLEVDGRPCLALVARTRDRVLVAVAGRTFSFEIAGAEARAGEARGRSGVVVAPMPGKVVTVLVAPGDTVEAGQPLVVLEAMKMETTLTAEVGGAVSAVLVVAGATVDAGAVLVEIGAAG
jgi:3-methylcrotonyl-CoA carboxylase alpha subunit